jgi:thioredoxin-related protein
MNYEKYPKDVYTNIGMIKGYAAVGNKNEAIKFADNAILLITDQNSKAYIEELKQRIKEGKDITNY